MSFNSLSFLIFYPVVVTLYFLLPQKLRWCFLLAASLFFYMSWNPALIVLILFTTTVSYVSGLVCERAKTKAVKRLCMLLSVTVSLAVLFFFKYLNFFISSVFSVAGIFGAAATAPVLDLILPVGISFYTFQTLSYTVDVYRGKIPAERHFGYYALFVSFFPQLVAGPIERPENLLPQLRMRHTPTWENFVGGGRKMLIGFFKKVVLADLCAVYVNSVFNSPETANGPAVALAAVLFAFQIYGDFSGYTDIAIGCAEIMGIRLMKNFDRPYSAVSVRDFWNRWHISLSTWLRDYIYFPLGGSRCSRARHCLNVFTVFLISGLWHGADWTFVLWGMIHGILRVLEELTKKPLDALTRRADSRPLTSRLWRVLRVCVTFSFVTFAWIFFRANSVAELGVLLSALFTKWGPGTLSGAYTALSMTAPGVVVSLLSVVCLVLLDRRQLNAPKNEATPALAVVRYAFMLFSVAIAWVILWQTGGDSSFIYFQF